MKKLFLLVFAVACLAFATVSWADTGVAVVDDLNQGMVTLLSDDQLHQVRAKGPREDFFGENLPYYFNLYANNTLINQAQVVRLDDIVGGVQGWVGGVTSYTIIGAAATGAPVTFSINNSTGVLNILDQRRVYWWPANSGWRLDMGLAYGTYGSGIAGVNSMISPGNYVTYIDEAFIVDADGNMLT